MRTKKTCCIVFSLYISWSSLVGAQTTSVINGYFFGDYYYNFKSHSDSEVDRNAFEFRRIYFTFENNITTDIKIRFRLESAHEKYGTESKINPFVKHAFLEWSNLIPMHKVYLGIIETNAFKNSEVYWGYRSIEKTIMDLNKISSSADMGLALKGDLMGTLAHHWLGVFNGTGYGSAEIDRYKKVGYAFWLTPVRGLMLEAYADYENQDPNEPQTAVALSTAKGYAGSSSYSTVKGFVGYDRPAFTLGVEAFWRTNKNAGIENVTVSGDEITAYTRADVKRFGYSLFGSLITPLPKLKLFARYDYYDQNTGDNVYTKFSAGKLTGGTDDDFTLLIAGLDYIPVGNIHLMPNVVVKSYSEEGKDSDITGRVTFYFVFDSGKIIIE